MMYVENFQLIFILSLNGWVISSEIHSHWPQTNFKQLPSHYPCFCTFTDAVFRWEDEQFYYKHDGDGAILTSDCHGLHIWDMNNDPTMSDVSCDEYYDVGYAFTIYYYRGSNYYHLFYDMVIPLFKDVYHKKSEEVAGKQKIMFMPTVETVRMQKLNWDTDAFVRPQDEKYWNEIARAVAGQNDYRPLDRNFIRRKKDICFKELKFGTPGVDYTDIELINGVSKYIMEQVNVSRGPFKEHKVGIITRAKRRKILNEEELIKAIEPIYNVDLVEFAGKTFREQVEMMQHYSIFVGINGAGLMNALFLPPYAVCIQLVPFEAQVNFIQYGALLQSRGPYMVWHNKHESLTRPAPGDSYNSRSDTIVHVEEFKNLIVEAISLSDKERKRLAHKDEL